MQVFVQKFLKFFYLLLYTQIVDKKMRKGYTRHRVNLQKKHKSLGNLLHKPQDYFIMDNNANVFLERCIKMI
ncbi:hypothetical protein N596_06955 [Streptococcus ilei]|nr:hypothetical protein N596_06955 [Streptococcus ilei]RJU49876.1 hypothetical protein DW738_07525 [Streptococcus sp. AM28-20]